MNKTMKLIETMTSVINSMNTLSELQLVANNMLKSYGQPAIEGTIADQHTYNIWAEYCERGSIIETLMFRCEARAAAISA